MSFRASRFALAFAALVCAATPLATTAPAFAQDDATIQMARERFQEGVKYYDAKQYTKARAAFLQAYALKKHPAVLLNLAQSELRSGYEADAAKHFSQYLRESKEASPAEQQEAQKGLAAAKANIGEIAVTVDEVAAELFVDGNLEGRSPLPGPIYLKPGSHNLEARKDGRTAASTVTAIAGQSGSVSLSFSGGAPPPTAGGAPLPPPPTGQGPTGPTSGPTGGPPPDAGTSDKPSFIQWAKKSPVAWIGGGVAVVGLASGIGFALAAKSSYASADDARNEIIAEADKMGVDGPCSLDQTPENQKHFGPACQTYQDRVDDGDSNKSISTVSFVIAGVAAAGTVIYYFIDTGSNKAEIGNTAKKKPSGVRAAVLPVLGPDVRGLGVVGQF